MPARGGDRNRAGAVVAARCRPTGFGPSANGRMGDGPVAVDGRFDPPDGIDPGVVDARTQYRLGLCQFGHGLLQPLAAQWAVDVDDQTDAEGHPTQRQLPQPHIALCQGGREGRRGIARTRFGCEQRGGRLSSWWRVEGSGSLTRRFGDPARRRGNDSEFREFLPPGDKGDRITPAGRR